MNRKNLRLSGCHYFVRDKLLVIALMYYSKTMIYMNFMIYQRFDL